jgi:YhcH/YjgK/YiaL family protein
MIIDSLPHADRYRGLSERFALAFEYLRTVDHAIADGRYEIEGNDIYATVMSYETKEPADLRHEAHRDFADIQLLLEGEEVMYYTPAQRLGPGMGYVEAKDYEHFGQPDHPERLVVRPGEFAVFFPGEGHRANCALHAPRQARKIVVKVRC